VHSAGLPPNGGYDGVAIAASVQNNSGTPRPLLWQTERAVDRLWEGEVQHEAALRCSVARLRGRSRRGRNNQKLRRVGALRRMLSNAEIKRRGGLA
jgi:hypothetical protein